MTLTYEKDVQNLIDAVTQTLKTHQYEVLHRLSYMTFWSEACPDFGFHKKVLINKNKWETNIVLERFHNGNTVRIFAEDSKVVFFCFISRCGCHTFLFVNGISVLDSYVVSRAIGREFVILYKKETGTYHAEMLFYGYKKQVGWNLYVSETL